MAAWSFGEPCILILFILVARSAEASLKAWASLAVIPTVALVSTDLNCAGGVIARWPQLQATPTPAAPPAYIVATNQTDVLKLLIVGAICSVAALVGGHFLTIRARVPVMPNIVDFGCPSCVKTR